MALRKGPPSDSEIHHVHHRIALGEDLGAIAQELGRKPMTLQRHLDGYKPEVHPQQVNSSLVVTTPSGATISGLTLQELIRLARAL